MVELFGNTAEAQQTTDTYTERWVWKETSSFLDIWDDNHIKERAKTEKRPVPGLLFIFASHKLNASTLTQWW